jgi:hypothetical protein
MTASSSDQQRPINLELRPESDRFDTHDSRWAVQVSTLWEALEEQAGTVHRQVAQAPGKKGGVETIILALGSAGAITAMVEVIKAWLGRDRSRSLKITSTDEVRGRRTVTLHGEHIDDETLREALKALGGIGDA